MPTFRDPDLLVYYKPEVRGIVIGGWEADTPAFGETGIPPEFGQQLLRRQLRSLRAAGRGWPSSARRSSRRSASARLINGPIPFSADGEFVMGKAPELDNAFVCAGFTLRHRRRRRRRRDDGGVDRRRAAQPRSVAARRPALRVPPHDPALHAIRAPSSSTASTTRIGYPRAGASSVARHPAQPAVRRRSRRGAPSSARAAAGSGRTGSRRRASSAVDRPSFGKPNWFEHVGSGASRRARARRAHRSDLLRQVRAARAGCAAGAAATCGRRCRQARRQRHLHPALQ